MKNALVGICTSALFLIPAVGRAQGAVPGSTELSVSVTFNNQTDPILGDGNKHIGYGLGFGTNVTNRFAVEAEYTYQSMGSYAATVDDNGFNYSVAGNSHYHKVGLTGRYYLSTSKRVVPYVLAGLGYLRYGMNASAVYPQEGSSGGAGGESGTFIGAGGGVSVYLSKNIGLRPEARIEGWEMYPSVGSVGVSVPVGTLSVFYQFGGKANAK